MGRTIKYDKGMVVVTNNETINLDKKDIVKRLEIIQRQKERLVVENKRIIEEHNTLEVEETELKTYLLQFPVEPLIEL